MKKLLSLPPNLVECFHDIMHADHKEWFCTSDPVGKKLGSGGGTAWLLNACREEEDKDAALDDWLAREKRILLHAGGQSRRLPGYAPSGKVLTPIPVFRWARGQRITQDLLSQAQDAAVQQVKEMRVAAIRKVLTEQFGIDRKRILVSTPEEMGYVNKTGQEALIVFMTE